MFPGAHLLRNLKSHKSAGTLLHMGLKLLEVQKCLSHEMNLLIVREFVYGCNFVTKEPKSCSIIKSQMAVDVRKHFNYRQVIYQPFISLSHGFT